VEVKINREFRDCTESIFFGLSMRQFIFSLLAVAVAAAACFALCGHFGSGILSRMYHEMRRITLFFEQSPFIWCMIMVK